MHKPPFLPIFVSAIAVIATPATAQSQPRERVSFNAGWRFVREDPAVVGRSLDYERVKPWLLPTGDDLLNQRPPAALRPPPPSANPADLYGRAIDCITPDFNDSAWRKLNLPHDYGIEGPFIQELTGKTAKLPWFGVTWYRKTFDLPATDAGRQIYLELDGAMAYAMVWINGQFAGGWPYGYTSWRVDLTPHIKPGAKNVVAIRLDNPRESSRWYPGGGIYRNTWLLKTAPAAIAQWGVHVTTPIVSDKSATIDVAVTLDNKTDARAETKLTTRLYAADATGAPAGPAIATAKPSTLNAAPRNQAWTSQTFTLENPRLWSLEQRNRYVAETTITATDSDGKTITLDRVLTPFGIRAIAHTAEGFFLNGKLTPIRGVCMHHDLGALGAALNHRALERQLEILQSFGANAIRTSHNPPAPELLELCDRMGILLQVESFDTWAYGKIRDDYSRLFPDWHEKDLRAMIRRDRNHPSVIQWSIGNEIREQNEPGGWKTAAHLAAIVRSEDRTRPVCAGFNQIQSGYNGMMTAIDIIGYNYKPHEYAKVRATHPHLPLMGAETASTISTRGVYVFPVSDDKAEGQDRKNYQMSSYDLYAPRWATTPDTEWAAHDQVPGVMGEYVWTGFDYLGEPTPYNSDTTNLLNFANAADRARMEKEMKALDKKRVPSRSSYFGIVDLAGFPKDRYYLYQSRWMPDKPMAHILPHWTWPERLGQVTPVHVYTSGDEAELFLNGKSLGRKKRAPYEYRFRWNEVVYEPGELKVVTYKNGSSKPWAEDTVRTAGPAAKLLAVADRAKIRADGEDLSFITVTVADKTGAQVPRSNNKIKFTITSGSGVSESASGLTIVAVDNGDPTSFEPFQAGERKAFNGLALVIVRAKPGAAGAFTLKAESEGLDSSVVTMTAE